MMMFTVSAAAVREIPEFVPFNSAAGLGLEPRYQGPEPCVLPLDDPAIMFYSKGFFSFCTSFKKIIRKYFPR